MYRLVMAILLVGFFTGCNTVDGMGKDLEKAGEAVQKSTK
jgi:entericidin B